MRSLIPLTMREMHLLGRSRSVYMVRAVVGLVGAGALLWISRNAMYSAAQVEIAYQNALQMEPADPQLSFWEDRISGLAEGIASDFAAGVLLFQILVTFFVPPLLASMPIARERRDGTLALMRLADVRGGDVWCAKFAAAFAQAELLLLSTLPIAAFASFFGGVSVERMAVQTGVLSCGVALLTALSLFIGTLAGSPNRALLLSLSIGFGILCAVLPQLPLTALDYVFDNPDLRLNDEWYERRHVLRSALANLAVNGAPDSIRTQPGSLDWTLLGYLALRTVLLVGVLAVSTIWAMARTPREPVRRRRPQGGRLWSFPTMHLIVAGTLPPDVSGSRITLLAAGAPLLVVSLMPAGVGWLAILFLMCYASATAMDALRKNNALDELAVTAVSDLELAQSIVGVNLARAKLCLIPLLIGGTILARFYLQDFDFMRILLLGDDWVSLDGITWVVTATLSAALILVLLFLQAFCTVAMTSVLRASGRSLWISAAGGALGSALLLAVSTVAPWYAMIRVQSGAYEGLSEHSYSYPTLAMLWNVLAASAVAYGSLKALASRVRTERPTRARWTGTDDGDAMNEIFTSPRGERVLR